jgi:hypothetical protein
MAYPHFARELYRRTKHKRGFSVNDLRSQQWAHLFKHKNQIGQFFRYLQKRELVNQIGHTKAKHKEAHGREIKLWEWSELARALYNE